MEQIKIRDDSFDALRGIAIFCVVAIHAIALPKEIPAGGLDAVSFWMTVFLGKC
jgi:peptidoglycan/LPS O-acetylase OafA/YrhL